MIKIINTNIEDLPPNILNSLDWSVISISDIKECSTEFISNNLDKFNQKVQLNIISTGKIQSNKESISVLAEFVKSKSYYNEEAKKILETVQFPYSVLQDIIKYKSSWGKSIALYQINFPLDEAVKFLDDDAIFTLFRNYSNPGLIKFITTNENAQSQCKKMRITNYIKPFIKSTEAKAIGINVKNHTISMEVLKRARACENGKNYCKKILKELNLTEIKWDDAVELIRNDKKLRERPSLANYMSWITNSNI